MFGWRTLIGVIVRMTYINRENFPSNSPYGACPSSARSALAKGKSRRGGCAFNVRGEVRRVVRMMYINRGRGSK